MRSCIDGSGRNQGLSGCTPKALAWVRESILSLNGSPGDHVRVILSVSGHDLSPKGTKYITTFSMSNLWLAQRRAQF